MIGCWWCLCTAAVEDSYSLWELVKAAAVWMSEPLVVSKIFPIPQAQPFPAMVAVKPWWFLSVPLLCPWFAPGSVLWWKEISWGISTPFPATIQYFIYSDKVLMLQEQTWILLVQFLLNQNFTAFILCRYVCVHTGLIIYFIFLYLFCILTESTNIS